MALTLKDLREACGVTANLYLTNKNEVEYEYWFENLVDSLTDNLQDTGLGSDRIEELLRSSGYYFASTNPRSWDKQVQSNEDKLFSVTKDEFPTEADLNRDFEDRDALLEWLHDTIEEMSPTIDDICFSSDSGKSLDLNAAEELIRTLIREES